MLVLIIWVMSGARKHILFAASRTSYSLFECAVGGWISVLNYFF